MSSPTARPSHVVRSALSKFGFIAERFVALWWITIPAKLRGLSATLSAIWSDDLYLTAWPRVATILVVAVFLFGFVEGGTHWSYRTIVGSNGFAGNVLAGSATADTWYRPTGIIFAENLLLLMVAVAFGSLSANLGMTLVLGYALGDVLWAGVKLPLDLRFNDALPVWVYRHVPLLVTYVLFLLIAAMPITMAKYFVRSAPSGSRNSPYWNFGIMAVTVSAMIYSWGCMAPMSFRIVWLWPGGTPPIQVAFFRDVVTTWLIPVALVALVARSILVICASKKPDFLPRLQTAIAQTQDAKWQLPAWVRAIVAAGMITLLISGFMHDPGNYYPNLFSNFVEDEIVFIGLALALMTWLYLLPHTRAWARWVVEVNQYPAALRLAAATVCSYLVCRLILLVPGTFGYRPGEFGPELAAVLIGIAVALAVLPTGWQTVPQSSRWFPRLPVPSASTRAALVAFVSLVVTNKLFGLCKDGGCCLSGLPSIAGAAAAGTIPGLGGIAAGVGAGLAGGTQGANTGGTQGANTGGTQGGTGALQGVVQVLNGVGLIVHLFFGWPDQHPVGTTGSAG